MKKEVAESERRVRFGVFEVDFRANELWRKGHKVRFQEQPCHILQILLKRPGELVSRDELRSELWPTDTFVDFDQGLNSAIMRLREAIGDSSENPRFIETLPRRGYRFIAPVTKVPDPALEGASRGFLKGNIPTEIQTLSSAATEEKIPWPIHKRIVVRRILLLLGLPIAGFAILFGLTVGHPREHSLSDAQALQISSHPLNTKAYEDYLKGRYYWAKRSSEGETKAIGYFQSATERDPGYALAYAGLADSYHIIGSLFGSISPRESAPKAKAAAMKALELDDTLSEARTTLATVRFNYDWDWAGAEREFRQALELNPNYATAHQRYSLYLMVMGRTRESVAEINRAWELDPLSIGVNSSLGWRLYLAREYNKAIEQLRNTIDMDPDFADAYLFLGEAYEQQGSYNQATTALEKAAAVSHDSPTMLGALGHAYAESGRKQEAQNLLFRLMEQSEKQYVSPMTIAIIYAGLRENDQAIDWLERAYQDRSDGLVLLKVEPIWDTMRSNPRFRDLVLRLSLP